MILPTAAILTIILASFLGTVHSILHNVTRLGGNQEVDFPLQSGEINGRMVIVDSRQVSRLRQSTILMLTLSAKSVVKG